MRDRKGFTLIELLIVVVIIGILAAIAIPKFSATRERAYISSMKSDLKNLATQQELWYSNPANQYVYADNTEIENPELGFVPSSGVTVAITGADQFGWGATAEHTGTVITCGIFFESRLEGGTHGAPPAEFSGVLKCTDEA
jgi:type IV pilus assembly protein PilA